MSAGSHAAGVVILRADGPGDEQQVVLVHRPRYDDWSLPKGKQQGREALAVTAVREAREETGLTVVLDCPLPATTYEVDGVQKSAHWWRAHHDGGGATAIDGDEVDQVRWLNISQAESALTYPADRQTLQAALAVPPTWPLMVLRHAEATKRIAWRASDDPDRGQDWARPLNPEGVRQSEELVELLSAYGISSIVSSPARRCRQTIQPYALAAGLAPRWEDSLSEEGSRRDPQATQDLVVELLKAHQIATVWCSHRPVLPLLMQALHRALGTDRHRSAYDPRLSPGQWVVLHTDADGVVLATDRAGR